MAKVSKTNAKADTKQRLVSAAIRLFAENGYDGTPTKKICEAAKANIAALHYYFESKENLYLSILRKFGEESLGSALRTLSEPANTSEIKIRLEMFLHASLELCFRDLNLARIVMNESVLPHPRSHEVFLSTFAKMSEQLTSFFAIASKRKLIARGIDPKFAASVIFAQLSQAVRHQPLSELFPKPSLTDLNRRNHWVSSTVQLVLEGVLPRKI